MHHSHLECCQKGLIFGVHSAKKHNTLGASNTNTNPSSTYKISKLKVLYTVALASACIYIITSLTSSKKSMAASLTMPAEEIGYFPIIKPTLKYGFVFDEYEISEGTIKEGQFLADILLQYKVDYKDIDKLARETRDIYDVKSLRANKPYTILNKDPNTAADYFITEPNPYHYVVYDLKDPARSEMVKRKVDKVRKQASGIVDGSLWMTMQNNGHSYELASKMEDALAWSVDFHHIQKGDKFKAYYDQDFIDGKMVGIGKLYGAYYETADQEYYAVNFETEKHHGFFDLNGRPMKKAFLKSPVKYSRISSRFSGRRFHPVLKRYKSHLGTDYAAPKGTPIRAVADGIVTKRAHKRNNGLYVKLKHDKVYSTQYLHMSKFKKDVKVGSRVKQGDVIGYVGKTGLATGYHVCYRFWKNGRQVDPRKQNLPPPDPMPEKDLPAYYKVRDGVKAVLDQIEYKEFPKEETVLKEEEMDTKTASQDEDKKSAI
jgi:murein DD-endopeptidase MepM/ murein hydrolase activator NlpD